MSDIINNKKCIFVGNRYYVFQKILEFGFDIVKVYAVKNSFLERFLIENEVQYEELPQKEVLIETLKNEEYDYLFSNGCPYILPVSEIKQELHKKNVNAEFINIHTSLLPDCKGKHPVNAALLFNRRHGVTCHYMDDGIDTGTIIEQIEIPVTDDISLELLYKLSFIEEGKAFEAAYRNGFKKKKPLIELSDTIYYSRKADDLIIGNEESVDMLLRKIRAFSVKGLYAKIEINNELLNIKSAKIINNKFVVNCFKEKGNNSVCLTYGSYILYKRDDVLIELDIIPK